jgi:hypothetical protein
MVCAGRSKMASASWFRRIAESEMAPADAIRNLNEEALASPPGANGVVVLHYFRTSMRPVSLTAERYLTAPVVSPLTM